MTTIAQQRAIKRLPPLETLRQILCYDPQTGVLTWRARSYSTPQAQAKHNKRVGQPAGYVWAKGYVRVHIDGAFYEGGRIAFLMANGREPSGFVDHIDGDPSNNRASNLREATRSQNMANSRIRLGSSSGLKGVSFRKDSGKWAARIMADRTSRFLGLFRTPEEAHAAYAKAAQQTHGAFARAA